MPFYFGTKPDFEDAQECPGLHISPNGKFWGPEPISLKQEQEMEGAFDKNTLSRRERRAMERLNKRKR